MAKPRLTIEELQEQMMRDALHQMRRHMAEGRMERFKNELKQETGCGVGIGHQAKIFSLRVEKAAE